MNPFDALLDEAKTAIREGNRDRAWRILHRYIGLNASNVEAWLLLGGLASPSASVHYLEMAAQLAPDDERVVRALAWARGRQTAALNENQDENTQPVAAASVESQPPTSSQPLSENSALRSASGHPKALTTIRRVGTVLFILVIVSLLAIGLSSLITGKVPEVFGRRVVIVTSGSMEPTFYTGSIILINTSPQSYQVGDVVMFWTDEDPSKYITHRIIDSRVVEGATQYQTRGDNNAAPDQTVITDEKIIGKYADFTLPLLGYFFSYIKSRQGILMIIILLGLNLVVTQAFRIRTLLAQARLN